MSKQTIPKQLKVVVVGDGAVGKTALVTTFGENGFPEKHIQTVAKHYEKKINYQGEEITLTIVDTGGQDEYINIRPVSYTGADAFIMCFAVNSRESF